MIPLQSLEKSQSVISNFQMMEGIHVPLEYIDPVTFEIMTNPVIVQPSGNAYDRSTIDKLEGICLKDPLTRAYIQSIIPNRALKTGIDRFLEQYPILKKELSQPPSVDCHDPQENIIRLSSFNFAQWFVDKNEYVIPANKELRIYNVNKCLCHFYLNYGMNKVLEFS